MHLRTFITCLIGSALLACGASSGSGDQADEDGLTTDVIDDAHADAGDVAPETAPHPLPEALATALDHVLAEYLAFSGDPGVSAAVRTGDGGTWAGAAGLAVTHDGQAAMTTQSQFRVGSNTKPFISALVMQLVDEGLVALDAPLTTYLPDYPNWSEITVRHLLGMQAGIPDYMWIPEFMLASVFTPATLTGPDVLLGYVKDLPLEFEPGADCSYNNTNYVIAGMIIQTVTGDPPELALEERFFEPLGMSHTFLDVAGRDEPLLAHGYLDLSIVGPVFSLEKDSLAMIPADWFYAGKMMDATYTFPPMFSWTAGAIVTTPSDALVFMRALLRGEIVSEASLAEMKKTNSCDLLGGKINYGLGMSHGVAGPFGPSWGHGGLNFGYEANTVHAPEADFTVSHMHNYLPEQSWKFEALLLEQLAAGADGAAPPCLLPEGFFAGDDGERVRLRFRGPINPAGAGEDGVTWVRGALQGEDLALYGFGTVARRVDAVAPARVELSSHGPSLAKEIDRRVTIVELPVDLLAGRDGVLADATFAAELGVLVSERPAEGQPDAGKDCAWAVPDEARPLRVAICGGEGFEAAAGETLKLFADLPVTTDADAVDAWLTARGRERCR